MCHDSYREGLVVKRDQAEIWEVALEPRKNARLKTSNCFPLNKSTFKNRAFLRGFSQPERREPAQALRLPYNMGYRSESRTFVLPEAQLV
jgi:hypothetical protein